MVRFKGTNVRVSAKGLDRIRKQLKALDAKIPDSAGATVKSAVQAGRDFAKAIAPKDTGALIRAIHFKTSGQGRNRKGMVISDQPNHPFKGKAIPYHVIMHMRPGQFNYSGDPQYMFTTRRFLQNNFPKQMKQAISAAIKGTGLQTTEV